MSLSVADRVAITELIALHGHLVDGGEPERLGEVFTADVAYDLTAFGLGVQRGLEQQATDLVPIDAQPLGHHVTNTVVVGERADGTVTARSKAIAVMRDGTAGSATYDDTLVRTPEGWRISHRVIRPRRTPLQA